MRARARSRLALADARGAVPRRTLKPMAWLSRARPGVRASFVHTHLCRLLEAVCGDIYHLDRWRRRWWLAAARQPAAAPCSWPSSGRERRPARTR